MSTYANEVYDKNGALVSRETGLVPVETQNMIALQAKADQAIANLEAADANWATLTAAQKDAAARLVVRVVAKLARLALGRLEAN